MSEQKRDRRDQYHDYYQRNKEAVKARYAAKRDEILAKQREKRHAAKAAEEARNPKPAPPPEPPKPQKPPKPAAAGPAAKTCANQKLPSGRSSPSDA